MPGCRQRPLDTLLLHSGFTPCAWSAPVVSAPCTCPCLPGSSLSQGCLTLEELGMLCLASLGWQAWREDPPLRASCGEDPWGRRTHQGNSPSAQSCRIGLGRLDGEVHMKREVAIVHPPCWHLTGSLATGVSALCVGDAPAELGSGTVSLALASSQLWARPVAAFLA